MKRNSKLLAVGCSLTVLVATQWGCAGPSKVTTTPKAETGITKIAGKVVETMDAGGYTYICVEKNGKKSWAAVPTTQVAVGQDVTLMTGMEMKNFPSKALNRTFESIIFSGGLESPDQAQPAGAPAKTVAAAAKSPADPHAGVKGAPTTVAEPVMEGKVVETFNGGGYTYISVEKDGKKSWSAVPLAQVKVGDEIKLYPGAQMGSFTSKTLNRTFDNIVFSSGIVK